jgi:hypothetical protein
MTADRDEATLVRQLYQAALLRDPEEWHDYLAQACPDHPRVRSRVLALLDARSLNLTGLTPDDGSSSSSAGTGAIENMTIGPYLIPSRTRTRRNGRGCISPTTHGCRDGSRSRLSVRPSTAS